MKRCNKCGEMKAEAEFCRRKGGADGRNSRCRKCMSEKDREYYEETREAILERERRYREENREAIRERDRRYYEENREAILERYRRRREENREVFLERYRRRREENLQVSRKYSTKSGRYSPEEDLEVMRTDMTILEIAIALGRTHSSVLSRRNRLRKKEKTNV